MSLQKMLPILAVLSTFFLGTSHADVKYPTKPVTIVVPQTAAGATDFLARLMAEKLSAKWGQPVVVDNKPGGGGIIGLQSVAKSPQDGYTLLMSSDGPQAINVSMYKNLPYDPVADFTPIATIATVSFLLVVRADHPTKDFKEFLAQAKKTPGIQFGSAGVGSLNHLIGEMINLETSAKMQHIPYKGAAPALSDLLGGHVPIIVASVPSVAKQIDSGALKALVVSSNKRSARLPNVPAVSEFGFVDFGVSPWVGLLAPGNLNPQILAKISKDVNEILTQPDVKAKIADLGMEILQKNPKEFSALLKADIEKWGKVAKHAGIQPQ
jgi:tripartite-type tricarboxylate transporter receptor subunit TctC